MPSWVVPASCSPARIAMTGAAQDTSAGLISSKSTAPIFSIRATSARHSAQHAKCEAITAARASGWLPAEQHISVAISGWCEMVISSLFQLFERVAELLIGEPHPRLHGTERQIELGCDLALRKAFE